MEDPVSTSFGKSLQVTNEQVIYLYPTDVCIT